MCEERDRNRNSAPGKAKAVAQKKQDKKGSGIGWVLGGLTVLGVGLAAIFWPGKANAKPGKPKPETEPGGPDAGGGAIGG